jgi:hypothetical protein
MNRLHKLLTRIILCIEDIERKRFAKRNDEARLAIIKVAKKHGELVCDCCHSVQMYNSRYPNKIACGCCFKISRAYLKLDY